MEARQAMQRLYAALNRASALDRSLYVARYLEKMEVEEVALAHDLSFGTAKRRLARATARLNRILERDAALVAYLDRSPAAARPPARSREPSQGDATVRVRPPARLAVPLPFQRPATMRAPGVSKTSAIVKERA